LREPPAENTRDPPVVPAASEVPATTETVPPAPLKDDPTESTMDPELPDVACPVLTTTDPLFP